MANNRMYLVHKHTNAKIQLARYYTNTGWIATDHVDDLLYTHFENNHTSSKFGDDWVIEYDHVTDERNHTADNIALSHDAS
jgi:hypothetical protein